MSDFVWDRGLTTVTDIVKLGVDNWHPLTECPAKPKRRPWVLNRYDGRWLRLDAGGWVIFGPTVPNCAPEGKQ